MTHQCAAEPLHRRSDPALGRPFGLTEPAQIAGLAPQAFYTAVATAFPAYAGRFGAAAERVWAAPGCPDQGYYVTPALYRTDAGAQAAFVHEHEVFGPVASGRSYQMSSPPPPGKRRSFRRPRAAA